MRIFVLICDVTMVMALSTSYVQEVKKNSEFCVLFIASDIHHFNKLTAQM